MLVMDPWMEIKIQQYHQNGTWVNVSLQANLNSIVEESITV
jgi:hypothetical protein